MDSCWHCGASFEPDPLVVALREAWDGVEMERHGEVGTLYVGPMLCDACRKLPPAELGAIIEAFMGRVQ